MFANYPSVVQILGWGVFMGLNGYIGGTCPGLNLAVLAFLGSFASCKAGIALLIGAFIITLLESAWYILNMYAAGMSSSGKTETPGFLQQGTGLLNLIISVIVFFILLIKFSAYFPLPKWLSITIVALFYVAGAWTGVDCWIPVMSHLILLATVWLLVALWASAPFALAIGSLVFMALAIIFVYRLAKWGYGKISNIRKAKLHDRFLEAAINNQQEKIAKLWPDVGLDTKNEALHNALAAKNMELIIFLIKQGVKINDAMQYALYEKDLDTINMLVEAGGIIEPAYVEEAAEYNFLPAIQLFVDKGVNINQEYNRPLSKACEAGYIEIAEYLLKTGKNSQETLDEALCKLCSSYNYQDNEAAKENLARLLLEHGAQINSRAGYFHETPLHGAGFYGPLEFVRFLVKEGGDVNAIDDNGATPLKNAIQADNLEIADFLLQQCAIDVSIKS